MADNFISEFEFLALLGSPQPPRDHVLVTSRPGVTGIALWRAGKRGEPFTLRSIVDEKSFEDADQLYSRYLALIGADPVTLIWSDIDQQNRGFTVCVLDVRRLRQSGLLASVGGKASPSLAYLECEWDLIAESEVEEEEA